jgi:hypothetical protein
MRHLKLKEVSEMVFAYMQENKISLIRAYSHVNSVLKEANPHTFEQVKNYLFNSDLSLKYINKDL